jgi:hypothetical protein
METPPSSRSGIVRLSAVVLCFDASIGANDALWFPR